MVKASYSVASGHAHSRSNSVTRISRKSMTGLVPPNLLRQDVQVGLKKEERSANHYEYSCVNLQQY